MNTPSQLSDDQLHLAPASALSGEFVRYGLVSAAGLTVDYGALWIQVQVLGASPVWASPAAFMAGLLVVYMLSVRWVFRSRRMRAGPAEFLAFALLGLAGLCITQVVMYVGVALLHHNYLAIKACAAGASFCANFVVRKLALF